jgi:hypothetical protein
MAIIDRNISAQGLSRRSLNVLDNLGLGFPKSSNTSAVMTTQTFSSTFNSTVAIGTQPDFARNLVYQISLTNGSASSAMISGGSIVVSGYDLQGSGIAETIALTALASLTGNSAGAVAFASLTSISFSNVSLHTSASSASNSVSFSIGVGNIIGLPLSVPTYATATLPNGAPALIPYAYLGTALQNGSYTVQTGNVGTAGISFSNALGSASALQVVIKYNAATSGGLQPSGILN